MWRTTVLLGYLLGAALSNMIQTVEHVRAMVGEEARLTCQLTQPKNVLQVTWQRITPGGTEDVGSCNKRFGTKINPPFQGLVEFADTRLHNTAIVVRNVTKADECCYRCLFNAYPEGAIYRKTCLTVYEQPEPTLHVTKRNGTAQTVVSCTAQVTSHRGDAVTLEVYVGSSKHSTLHTANAASGTDAVTVVASAVTLERLCGDGTTQVRCVVRLHSGAVKQASALICSDKQDVCEKSETCQSVLVICVAAVIVGVGLLIVTFGLVFRPRQGKIRSYNDPESHDITIPETKEPLATQKNKPIEYPNT